MSKIKLLLDVVSDLRSLADSLQAVADAVAQSGQEQPEQFRYCVLLTISR